MALHVCVHGMPQLMSRSEDSLWSHVDAEDGTLVVRLGDRCLYPLSHLPGSQISYLMSLYLKLISCNVGIILVSSQDN